jgi:hypothetical protein
MRRCCLVAVASLLAGFTTAGAAEDCLSQLGRAIGRFRGLGYADVETYRVELRLPDDPDEAPVPLEELWRAPDETAVRALDPGTNRAIVRTLALYLEPLFIARTSLLEADWAAYEDRLRAASKITCRTSGKGKTVAVALDSVGVASSGLPEVFRSLRSFEATIDAFERLLFLEAQFRDEEGLLKLRCSYDAAGKRPQPDLAVWTLPNGDSVEARTTFRAEGQKVLPESRVVTFPSRYDPGETERIEVRYANYRIGVEIPPAEFAAPGVFRYGPEGLVAD